MAAKREDWKSTPLPAARASISFDRIYSIDEYARIREGHVPEEMEDKWFAFFEEPWLYLHRSWTGFGIYEVRFDPTDGGYRVAEVLVSRDPLQYTGTDDHADALQLAILLDRYAGRDTKAAWDQYMASRHRPT